MKLYKAFKHALNMVIHSRLRSWLTIIGIVIGVASVISIVSIGEGMEREINSQMSGLGQNLITITEGYSKAMSFGPGRGKDGGTSSSDQEPIGYKDLLALKSFSEIEYIDTQIYGSVDVEYMGSESSVSVTGVDTKVWQHMTTNEIGEGRLLGPSDKNVVVIGESLANGYFDSDIGINKMISIEGKSFRVVGILEEGTGRSVYMPLDSAYQVIEDATQKEYGAIVVQVKEDVDVEVLTEKIEAKLRTSRHVTEKTQDFTVSNSLQMMNMVSEMTGTMTLFLTSIAGVSLLVGAIGIANTMFTSVLEKTKEIGIMKAIGATNRDILFIFLFNAGVIGFVGGVIGVIFGMLGSGFMALLLGMETVVTWDITTIALLVSIFVGMVSGFIPAWQGSKQNPVDALRYE